MWNCLVVLLLVHFKVSNGYEYVSTPLPYDQAQAFCETMFASNLATITDLTDIANVNADIMDSSIEVWMGLNSDEPNGWWLFQNQDICPELTNGACVDIWGTVNPSSGVNAPLCIDDVTGFQCAYYIAGNELVYNDLDCTTAKPFVCEDNNIIPPPSGVSFIGSCPCSTTIDTSTCTDANKVITIECVENDLGFDVSTDAIRSCIDISPAIIPSSITVQDVIVSAAFSHEFVGDIEMYLTKGAAQSTLIPDALICLQKNVDVTFSDDATAPPATGCDSPGTPIAIGGIKRPSTSLSVFDGNSASGRWALILTDGFSGDGGVFGTWSLQLTLSECPGGSGDGGYVFLDDDSDGVDDRFCDNCPADSNQDQADVDSDGIGDVCDLDMDGDGIDDTLDNCPMVPNSNQNDLDGDSIGDACDTDIDGDNIDDTVDNCVGIANNDQADNDGDGAGDVCDSDDDNDGVLDTMDNCPNDSNADQTNSDNDKFGDACDNCPNVDNLDQADNYGVGIDTLGDVCGDIDNDGYYDAYDNCPEVANDQTADFNNNGIGDACEDFDNDGVLDIDDNCPEFTNPNQKNLDNDEFGDACDYDIDGDGIPNKYDYCPRAKGPYSNKGCPEYGRRGRDDGRGRNDQRDDRYKGRGKWKRGGLYSYSGSSSDSSSGKGRGRGRRGSSSSSSSDSKDERKQLEDLLRQLEEQYRGSSKY